MNDAVASAPAIKVYHKPFLPKGKAGDFALVATVATQSLDEAFERTNSIDCPWQENEGVVVAPGGERARSTSIGDVMQLADGTYMKVAPAGFEPCGPGWSPIWKEYAKAKLAELGLCDEAR